MNRKIVFLSAAAILLAGFGSAAVMVRDRQAESAARTAVAHRDALVRFHAPVYGRAEAPVNIVEFFDPACETCAAFYPLTKDMMAAHPGRIRMTLRYTPFHQGSDKVVMLLEAARKQGKHQQALETLLAAQDAWVVHHVAHADRALKVLEQAGLGLNLEQLVLDMTSPEIAGIIARDMADAQALGVSKTPTFFVNGKPMPSFGATQLKALVDEALAATGG